MVYITLSSKSGMKHGTTLGNKSSPSGGSHCVSIQEKSHSGHSGIWWSYSEHFDKRLKRDRNTVPIYQNVPLSNCMVGSVSKRGITRREYALCILETSYPCQNSKDPAEFEKPIKRKRENGFGESPRSVRGNQPAPHGERQIKNSSLGTKERRLCHRLSSYDRGCDTVLQNLGSDLIAPWLTPLELLRVRFACNYDWCWSKAWHGGFVTNKCLASFTAAMVQHKNCLHYLFERYPAKVLLEALFYILPVNEYIKYAEMYGTLLCLRKLL